jgi:hypothetical protein
MATHAQARAMLRRYARKLLAYKNVVAVGLGRKNGDTSRQDWCIRVHVTKRTKRRTRSSVPRVLPPPRGSRWLVPVATDVKEVGEVKLHLLDVQASSHFAMSGEYGTCTGVFKIQGSYYGLTCGHVASMELTGLHNLPNGYLPGSSLIPCNLTNATATTMFGLVGHCVRCSSDEQPIDLALVLLDTTEGNPEGHPRLTGFRSVFDHPLQVGETLTVLRYAGPLEVVVTGDDDHYVSFLFDYNTSQGTKSVTYDGLICYPAGNGNQVLGKGDSGSCVVDSQNQLVGIHMAGSDTTGYAITSDQLLNWARQLTIVQAP